MEALTDAGECRRDYYVTLLRNSLRCRDSASPHATLHVQGQSWASYPPHCLKIFSTSVLLLAAMLSTSAKPGTSRRAGRHAVVRSAVQPASLFARRARTNARSADMNRASIDGTSLAGATCWPCSCENI